jgi:hypothetical protein
VSVVLGELWWIVRWGLGGGAPTVGLCVCDPWIVKAGEGSEESGIGS